jgi:ribosomal protein L11 methyltransferase
MSETLAIQNDILRIVSGGPLSPRDLVRRLSVLYPGEKPAIQSSIRALVQGGRIAYAHRHGRSMIERSLASPVRLSRHVVVKPPGLSFEAGPGDVVVDLAPGSSFGAGDHPTTRLSVMGLEYVMGHEAARARAPRESMLDVGTGSGILAIAAAGFGFKKALGIDMDPVARFEARENVRLNGHENKIAIRDVAMEEMDGAFFLIAANLRWPTIKRLSPVFFRTLKEDGFIVFSGVYEYESPAVMAMWNKGAMRLLWRKAESGWSVLVFQKTSGLKGPPGAGHCQ